MKPKYYSYFLLLFAFVAFMLVENESRVCNKTCTPGINEFLQSNNAIDPHQYPADWMALQRMYPHNKINTNAYRVEMRKAAKLQYNTPVKLDWESAGPENIGGRITDIEGNPQNLDEIIIGAATGGIFKTQNGGADWENIFINQPIVTIGDIALDPINPNIIYAGTGEANSSSYSFIGDGIHKTEDGGESWEHLGLENSAYIARIIVDYENTDRLFVAACGNLFSADDERGIYRSDDGGQNWERVLFLTDSTAAIDLVQHPENPDILIAAFWERIRGLNYRRSFGISSGLWKTVDGGDNWYELTNGLPTGNDVGRIGVDIAKSNPNIVYAFYDRQSEVSVFRSDNLGESWSQTNDYNIQGMNSSFGWYFGQIRVDPTDEDQFYIMGVDLNKSINGGNSYINLAGYWNMLEIHVDHHAMWIDDNSGRIFEGNDGGLYYSDDEGYSWTKINNLPITQFYHIEIDYLNPDRIYGGTQDNSTIRTLTGNLDAWHVILGGDGMYTRVDYTNSNIIYAEYQWGNLYRSMDMGYNMNYISWAFESDRKNWSSPYILHPEDPSIIYFGTYRLWKGTNYGDSWSAISGDLTLGDDGSTFHTIATVDISKLNTDYLLTGSDDGLVHISLTGGNSWQNISEGLPQRWITSVVFDPFDENTIYVTLSGFRWDEPTPHVFKSTNLGQDWINISNNLPDIPVNEIVCDPEYPEKLIVATDAGLFVTIEGGIEWYGISSGMPNSACVSLQIHEPSRELLVGTYGNSCFRISLDNLGLGIENSKITSSNLNFSVNPNPISNSATIKINAGFKANAKIDIFDLNGKFIAQIFDGLLQKGENHINFDIQNINQNNNLNGINLCRLQLGDIQKTKKIMILK